MCISTVLHKFASRIALALVVIGLTALASSASADDLQEASKLFKAGQYEPALARVDKAIAAKPKDPEARFLKGLILTEQGNSREAIEVFQKLTEDYPRLPEPYNNLAVIYASQGEYEKARVALEKSIHTHPSYATAYENLGDVYARLASRAYDKALQLDSKNTGAQDKLALARELVGGVPRSAQQTLVAAAPSQAPASPLPVAPPPVAPPPVAPPPVAPRPEIAARTVTREVKPAAVKAPSASPVATRIASADPQGEVVKTLNGWAQAWSRKDADAYLSYYAKDFTAPKGQTRPEWEKSRRARVAAPKSISVHLSSVKVALSGANRATATFRQQYRSDIFTGSSRKTLVLVKNDDGRWLIQQETVK
jgi:Flp pilus assembly protein TadD